MSAMTYSKVPFEWTETSAPVDDVLDSGLAWATYHDTPEPRDLVAAVLSSSPGPEDCHAVEMLGADEAARRCLALEHGFSYLPERWHVLTVDGDAAGFVLPVIYDGCSRNGVDEATIFNVSSSV